MALEFWTGIYYFTFNMYWIGHIAVLVAYVSLPYIKLGSKPSKDAKEVKTDETKAPSPAPVETIKQE